MDISILTQYFSIIVVGICLCVGYVIKNSLDFIPNKYIPTNRSNKSICICSRIYEII